MLSDKEIFLVHLVLHLPVLQTACVFTVLQKDEITFQAIFHTPHLFTGTFCLAERGESFLRPERPSTSHHRPPRSLPKLGSKSKSGEKSDDELQFPKELMEDWSTMEVCVDCKKFISDIISSSRRSLTLANKRARLKRKTQSFYLSSTGTSEYRPTERTINEI
ncbi:unnamed protein product [Staurois parvus]|uniref:Uncharacterized protein n=1 Tax=Staurois parvus TaxID=386267 RepID=A0ABN9ARV5_9NEOB|nr:unnamed protein product [Staurois parvus]